MRSLITSQFHLPVMILQIDMDSVSEFIRLDVFLATEEPFKFVTHVNYKYLIYINP
jgi:hypothetical protein